MSARAILRAEGAALALGALAAQFLVLGQVPWGAFLLGLVLPDLSLLAWLAGPRVGRPAYNAAHTLLVPAGLLALAPWLDSGAGFAIARNSALLMGIAFGWFAHVGLDRLLGYGLKTGDEFRDTHLGRIGRG